MNVIDGSFTLLLTSADTGTSLLNVPDAVVTAYYQQVSGAKLYAIF